jgi:hypothetical protein
MLRELIAILRYSDSAWLISFDRVIRVMPKRLSSLGPGADDDSVASGFSSCQSMKRYLPL